MGEYETYQEWLEATSPADPVCSKCHGKRNYIEPLYSTIFPRCTYIRTRKCTCLCNNDLGNNNTYVDWSKLSENVVWSNAIQFKDVSVATTPAAKVTITKEQIDEMLKSGWNYVEAKDAQVKGYKIKDISYGLPQTNNTESYVICSDAELEKSAEENKELPSFTSGTSNPNVQWTYIKADLTK